MKKLDRITCQSFRPASLGDHSSGCALGIAIFLNITWLGDAR
jgi:hypothetical protein